MYTVHNRYFLYRTCPLYSIPKVYHSIYIVYNSGCGKKRGQVHINWFMARPAKKKVAPSTRYCIVTGTTLRTIGPVPADSRQ